MEKLDQQTAEVVPLRICHIEPTWYWTVRGDGSIKLGADTVVNDMDIPNALRIIEEFEKLNPYDRGRPV